jgi:SpoVK/Ycf46/Vps4 family AAA+-type ATPase
VRTHNNHTESGATFLNIKASNILSKYYGESEKTCAAIFSLARKLAPAVIFIDEIDTLLPQTQSDNASSSDAYRNTMKGVLLSEWDGLANYNNSNTKQPTAQDLMPHGKGSSGSALGKGPVLVIAATNRPADIDEAILRRLALSVEIPLPDATGRADILNKLMKSEQQRAQDLDLHKFARATEGFSGSDLRGKRCIIIDFFVASDWLI